MILSAESLLTFRDAPVYEDTIITTYQEFTDIAEHIHRTVNSLFDDYDPFNPKKIDSLSIMSYFDNNDYDEDTLRSVKIGLTMMSTIEGLSDMVRKIETKNDVTNLRESMLKLMASVDDTTIRSHVSRFIERDDADMLMSREPWTTLCKLFATTIGRLEVTISTSDGENVAELRDTIAILSKIFVSYSRHSMMATEILLDICEHSANPTPTTPETYDSSVQEELRSIEYETELYETSAEEDEPEGEEGFGATAVNSTYSPLLDDTDQSTEAVKSEGKGDKDEAKASMTLLDKAAMAANNVSRKYNLFIKKVANTGFYKKYMGRIPHMYERYGDKAQVTENKMIDDPVQILEHQAKDFIMNFVKDVTTLHASIMQLAEKISETDSAEVAVKICNQYLGQYTVPREKIKTFPKQFIRATKHKLATALLKDHKVYGYTVDSIVENKFPPPNHTMVACFVWDAHERPAPQAVTDIIKNVDSFKLISKNEKEPVFDISKMCNTTVNTGVQKKDLVQIKAMRASMIGKPKALSALKKSNVEDDDKSSNGKVKSEERGDYKAIWTAVQKAMKYVVTFKRYTAQMINMYFEMMVRIDGLCKRCVKALLDEERMVKDERHKTGFKGQKLSSHRTLDQSDDNTKTLGEKEVARNEARSERAQARAEHKSNISEVRRNLHNQMKMF